MTKKEFIDDTEIESIFKACEWVLRFKGLSNAQL